jgi:hypothetical protein
VLPRDSARRLTTHLRQISTRLTSNAILEETEMGQTVSHEPPFQLDHRPTPMNRARYRAAHRTRNSRNIWLAVRA